jgi:hypothetical protein
MIRKFVIGIFLSGAFLHSADAQHMSGMFSMSPVVAVPIGEFEKAISNDNEVLGLGFNTNLLFSPRGKKAYSPIWFGVDYTYISLGRDKQSAQGNLPPFKTTFNYHGINGIGRLFLTDQTEGITPFVDGMLGMKIYNTRTKVDKDLWDTIVNDDQPEVIHTTNDVGLGYGIGLGFFKRKQTEAETKTSFTLRVAYLWGDKIQYLVRGSVKVDNDTINYETGYTNTNMILIQLGINIFN